MGDTDTEATMFTRSSLATLFAAFALSACQSPVGGGDIDIDNPGQEDPTPVIVTADGRELFAGDKVGGDTVLPPQDCLDYQAQIRLLNVEAQDGNGLLDRLVWNRAVKSALDNFQQPLTSVFSTPFQALGEARSLDFEVQQDGTLTASTTINVDGVDKVLTVILDPNDDFTAGSAQFLVDGVLRFELSGDFAATNVNVSIFDAAGVEQFDVSFVRNAANFTLVITNVQNANKFTIDLNGTNLLIERDLLGDGVLQEDFEFRVTVNVATFNGEFTAVVPVLGAVTLGF
jgi:hypothetical protein